MYNRLTTKEEYTPSNLVFSTPIHKRKAYEDEVHDTYTIHIETIYPDGITGPLMILSPSVFTYGVDMRINLTSRDVYRMGINLLDRTSPTTEQYEFVDWINI